jgi:hypothetical protein
MKFRQLKIPIGLRVILFIIGAAVDYCRSTPSATGSFTWGIMDRPLILHRHEPRLFFGRWFLFSRFFQQVFFMAPLQKDCPMPTERPPVDAGTTLQPETGRHWHGTTEAEC